MKQRKKVLHVLYRKIRNLHLSLDSQLYLFAHTIVPILLYGCEIWGFHNVQIENVSLRKITKLRKSIPICMLHAELGRHPLNITFTSRIVGYWLSIINSENTKIAKFLYKVHFFLPEANNGRNLKWIDFIKDILISVGRIDLFYKTVIDNSKVIKANIIQTIKDLNIQNSNSHLLDSSKGRNYALFKANTEIENYLLSLTKRTYIPLLKFRTANHKLPVKKGCWDNVPYADIKCNLCHTNDLGDVFHYLLVYSIFDPEKNVKKKKKILLHKTKHFETKGITTLN